MWSKGNKKPTEAGGFAKNLYFKNPTQFLDKHTIPYILSLA